MPGSRFIQDGCTRIDRIVGETRSGEYISVYRSASGNSSQNTSKHFSPPLIANNQSWTIATRIKHRPQSLHALGGTRRAPAKLLANSCGRSVFELLSEMDESRNAILSSFSQRSARA